VAGAGSETQRRRGEWGWAGGEGPRETLEKPRRVRSSGSKKSLLGLGSEWEGSGWSGSWKEEDDEGERRFNMGLEPEQPQEVQSWWLLRRSKAKGGSPESWSSSGFSCMSS
jgi:hypothetical protein